MAKTLNATYDPSKKWMPIEEGKYPAHITGLSTREMNTRAGEAIIVNLTYVVNEAVSEYEQPLWEMDGYDYVKDSSGNRVPVMNGNGEQATGSCSHLENRELKDNGFFIFTDTSSASKNSRYFTLLENLGIQCEDTDGIKRLVLLEEEDVVGKPVHVTVKREQYVTAATKDLPLEQQDKRTTFKVANVELWKDGPTLSQEELEEDVPF